MRLSLTPRGPRVPPLRLGLSPAPQPGATPRQAVAVAAKTRPLQVQDVAAAAAASSSSGSVESTAAQTLSGFPSRWLVITPGGDCLLDYAAGACDAERDIPVGTLCSLAAAVLQFLAAAGGEEGPGPATRTVRLASFQLVACMGPEFTVLAVTAATSPVPKGLRWKVREVFAGLCQGKLRRGLSDLASSSAHSKEEQLGSYTLSSVLSGRTDSEGVGVQAPLPVAVAATAALELALRRSYVSLLRAAVQDVARSELRTMQAFCLLDGQLDLVAMLVPAAVGLEHDPVERRAWRPGDLVLAAASEAAAGTIASDSSDATSNLTLWCWSSQPSAGQASVVALLSSNGLPWVAVEFQCTLTGARGKHGQLVGLGRVVQQLQPEAVEGQDSATSLVWAASEVARCLAHAINVQAPSAGRLAVEGAVGKGSVVWAPDGQLRGTQQTLAKAVAEDGSQPKTESSQLALSPFEDEARLAAARACQAAVAAVEERLQLRFGTASPRPEGS